MNSSKRNNIVFCILVGFFIIGVFLLTLSLRSAMIDKEIDDMNVIATSESNLKVTGVKVIYEDKEYSNLDSLANVISAGVVCKCEVSYSDGSVKKKDCYVVYSNDDSVNKIVYEDNDYGKIILPKKERM